MNKNTVPFTGHTLRGELALLVAVCINSLGVVLMLYSGAGISAISSVPFAFSEVLPKISLGTWKDWALVPLWPPSPWEKAWASSATCWTSTSGLSPS